MTERENDDLVESTSDDLEGAESKDDKDRLETLERVREKLESELEERDGSPPA